MNHQSDFGYAIGGVESRDLTPEDQALIDRAWERHKAAAPVCDCGAATEGKWADKHYPRCSIFNRDRITVRDDGPDWDAIEGAEIEAERGYNEDFLS